MNIYKEPCMGTRENNDESWSAEESGKTLIPWWIQGEGRGIRTPLSDLKGFLLSQLSIVKPSPGSTIIKLNTS